MTSGLQTRMLTINWDEEVELETLCKVLRVPVMRGVRVLDLSLFYSIRPEDVIRIFANLPHLISLRAAVRAEGHAYEENAETSSENGSFDSGDATDENDEMSVENSESEDGDDNNGNNGSALEDEEEDGNEPSLRRIWANSDPAMAEVWKRGFKKLRALRLDLHGRSEQTLFDWMVGIVDGLGPTLESLQIDVYVEDDPNAGSSDADPSDPMVIHQVAANCPNLKDFTAESMWFLPIDSLISSWPNLVRLSLPRCDISDNVVKIICATCLNLKVLDLSFDCCTALSFEYLTRGPLLRGFRTQDLPLSMSQKTIMDFLQHRGQYLEVISLRAYDSWLFRLRRLEVVDMRWPFITDQPHIRKDVLNLLRSSCKLESLRLPLFFERTAEIREAAAEKKTVLSVFPEIFMSYVETMEDRWIGL
ncbi:hypothetical protein HK104_002741 [Borealophlyctis nickersoniae]|nr:hypothetical protein HK104_002741 [Borealophlyctis nickersoniae]